MGIHGYHSDITSRKDTIGIPLVSFSLLYRKVQKNMLLLCSVSAMCRYFLTLSRSFLSSSLNTLCISYGHIHGRVVEEFLVVPIFYLLYFDHIVSYPLQRLPNDCLPKH